MIEPENKQYGFSNKPEWLEYIKNYRDAAVADGWSIEPTYNHESIDRAARLHRDGFLMSVLTRENTEPKKYRFEANIHIWGPDKLSIRPPENYDFEAIKAGLRTCPHCGAVNVDTARYSFAGRACQKCLPALKAKHEYPGWCD